MVTGDRLGDGAAVFLDRDGTLIDTVRDEELGILSVAFHPSQIQVLPGVVEGLSLLSALGFRLAIATNQPGPAKGQFSAEAVRRTNDALVDWFRREAGIVIERVAVCMHHEVGGPSGDASLVGPCSCRKPRPGLITGLVEQMGVDPSRSWMIGDSPSDIAAGRGAHVRTGLIFAPNRCELCPLRSGPDASSLAAAPDVHGTSLLSIARAIERLGGTAASG